jgi:uncharacterized protein YjbK
METITATLKRKKAKPAGRAATNEFELKSLLKARNINTNKFEPIGAGFYHQYEDCFDASVICIDKEKFIAGQPYLVKIILEDFTNEEYVLFRKKFEVIINPEYRSYYNLNINEVMLHSQV